MNCPRVLAAVLAFGWCMVSGLSAPGQTSYPASRPDGASPGRLTKPIDNRTSTTQGTVYGQIKAQREAERQERLHSRYQPKTNAAAGPKPFVRPSAIALGDSAPGDSNLQPLANKPLYGGAGKQAAQGADLARGKAVYYGADKPETAEVDITRRQASYYSAGMPGAQGTEPTRIRASRAQVRVPVVAEPTRTSAADRYDADQTKSGIPDLLKDVDVGGSVEIRGQLRSGSTLDGQR